MSKSREEVVAALTDALVAARAENRAELASSLEAAIAELAPKPRRAGSFFDLPEPGPLPDWARVPAGTPERPWRPPADIQVIPVLFRAHLTRAPQKGDRTCLLWELSDGEERVAILRARGDANRVQTELAKQMIRSVDDQPADWSGLATPGSVEQFWREIGAKYRTMIVHLYNQLHVMTRQESDDFLDNCVAVVTAC